MEELGVEDRILSGSRAESIVVQIAMGVSGFIVYKGSSILN